jgi:hypothetical protein
LSRDGAKAISTANTIFFWDQNEMGAIQTVRIKSVVVEVVEKLHNFWLKDVPEVSVKRGSKTGDVRHHFGDGLANHH